jgi:hypothetical protein
MIKADYATTNAVDAVSAVLMVDSIRNEFVTDPTIGASSEWVVTLPTEGFYVDPGIVGTSDESFIAPFQETFGGGFVNSTSTQPADPGESCFSMEYTNFSREGQAESPASGFPEPPITAGPFLCNETSVVAFNQGDVKPGVPSRALSSVLGQNFPAPWASGWSTILFNAVVFSKLRPSIQNTVFEGIPAVGFLASNYVNANVTPGVLSNYSAAYPHRSTDPLCYTLVNGAQQPCQ